MLYHKTEDYFKRELNLNELPERYVKIIEGLVHTYNGLKMLKLNAAKLIETSELKLMLPTTLHIYLSNTTPEQDVEDKLLKSLFATYAYRQAPAK